MTHAEFERLLEEYGWASAMAERWPSRKGYAQEVASARAAVLAAFDEAMREGGKP